MKKLNGVQLRMALARSVMQEMTALGYAEGTGFSRVRDLYWRQTMEDYGAYESIIRGSMYASLGVFP